MSDHNMTYEDRIDHFHAIYGNEQDPAITLAGILTKAGNVICKIVGEPLGNSAMHIITKNLGNEWTADEWRAAVEDSKSGLYSEWPMGSQLHALMAFARYGIDLQATEEDSAEITLGRLTTLVQETLDFINEAPPSIWLGDLRDTDLEQVAGMARGRFALDHLEAISPEDLALLGSVSPSRMRAMMSGESALFHRDSNKLVPAHEASDWLATRDHYYPSIWQDQSGTKTHRDEKEVAMENPIFVPVAADGTIFHPGLKRTKGYEIGEKGATKYIEDFDEALAELSCMVPPRWRRPSATSGVFGIVSGTSWTRISRKDLFR